MRAEVFYLPRMLVITLIAIVFLAASPNSIIVSAQEKDQMDQIPARPAYFNLTKKLANQEINITICCEGSKCLPNVGKTDKNGLFWINEVQAFKDNICNLTVTLKTEYGSFLVYETIGAKIEKLLNATIYPRFLINATLNTLTLEGMNLEAKNFFAKIVADNYAYLNLSETKSILLGAPERGEEKVVDLSIVIVTKNIYVLNSSQIEIKKTKSDLKIYLNRNLIPLINKNDIIIATLNITTPLTNTTFNLCYLSKSGFAKPSSGVVKLIEVEVPLAYNSSLRLFSEHVKIQPNASIITVREYNNTAAKVNITIEFAGEKVSCKSVNLSNNSRFQCDGIESTILFKEGETIIVVDTTSRPIRGRVRFDSLIQQVLFLGTIEVPGVPKNASGTLKMGSFNVAFECVRKPSDGHACKGSVFLWPLALFPIPEQNIAGELRVNGEVYRLKVEMGKVHAGVWGFALAAIAVIAVVAAVLARRPTARAPREKVEVYDEHYDLG